MVGKAKMTLSAISIPGDRTTAMRTDATMQTLFELRARVRVSKRKAGSLSGEGIDALELEWKETGHWFELTNGTWHFKGTQPDHKDLHAANPTSNTFTDWRTARYFFASVHEIPDNNPPAGLTAAVAKAQTTEEKDKAAKHWIAENGFEWTTRVAKDVPAMGLRPAAGSGGGGGPSLVTSNSRRRVLYFDLGFKGSSPRVTATQILETVNGTATIHEFFVPAISERDANDAGNLAFWRTQLGLHNWRPSPRGHS